MSSSTHSHSGKQKLRVTESRNELTTDIDVVDAKGIIRVLRNCDAQIFSGYREYENIFEIPDTSKVIGVIMRVLKVEVLFLFLVPAQVDDWRISFAQL